MPTYFDDDPVGPPDFDGELLGDALRRTAEGLPAADTRGLVRDGLVRGRRMRRRRAASVTAGVAVLAIAGAGGVLAAAGAGHGQGGGVASAPARPVLTSVAKATPAPRAMSGAQVAHLFVSMLPQGKVSGVTARGTRSGDPYAHVVLDDGRGPAAIEVGVARDDGPPAPCPPHDAPGTSCTKTHVHGGTLTVLKSYEYPDHRAETKDWLATFVLSSGASVQVSEWNAAAEKGAPVSRPNPPLDAARLRALVTDPRWQKVIDATPEQEKAAG